MPDINTGFSNFHYRVIGWNASIKPKALTGAIKLSYKPQTQERTVLVRTSGGLIQQQVLGKRESIRTASLQVISLPESFLIDVLGWEVSDGGRLVEGEFPEKHLQIRYETNNLGEPMRHLLYDVVVSKPSFDVSTISSTPSADTRSLELTVNPTANGKYQARVRPGDPDYDTWFDQVT